MRWRTRGGDAGNRGDTGRACLSPGPDHAQAGQIEGGAGTSTRTTVPIVALYCPASLPRAARGLQIPATCRFYPCAGRAECSTPGWRIPRIGRSRKESLPGSGRPASLRSRQTGEAAPRVERSARTALGGARRGSAGGGREAPPPGLDVDARAARDGKCLIKPRLARRDRLLAAPP